MLRYLIAAISVLSACCAGVTADDSNQLAYLSESNPWYPDKDFPKLTTPQWVGEEGVECVVVLAIDDMRDTAKYEQYLRPILNRLKQFDGRAPVSIMTNDVNPDDPHLQVWLDEGLSIECHTADHPCPLLQGGDFEKARSTYNRCIDQLAKIPRSKPVAFRTPCCDSLNTVSPRFYSEIFPGTTEDGNFLQIDSSVMNFFTSEDESIPRDLVLDENGNERFWKYKVKNLRHGETVHNNFVNYITNYPYPYVINNSCWQFPCVAPSDWSAQHLHGINNQQTVDDLKGALDITVHKQGVFNLVFHPHGWIKADQVVELIDHAVAKHGSKVKFLTFREAADRLNHHLLDGNPIRSDNGTDNGIRIIDVDRDGFQDVVIGDGVRQETLVWQPDVRSWTKLNFPALITHQTHFAQVRGNGQISVLAADAGTDNIEQAWVFKEAGWEKDRFLQDLVSFSTAARNAPMEALDRGVANKTQFATRSWRFHDINHDGVDEAIVTWDPDTENGDSAPVQKQDIQLFRTSGAKPVASNGARKPAGDTPMTWRRLRFPWPTGSAVPSSGLDPRHFRFADLNLDGHDDLIGSSGLGTYVALFDDFEYGWTKTILNVDSSSKRALPPLRNDDGDIGFFIRDQSLYWSNELTSGRPDLFDRVSFDELLASPKDEEARNNLPPVPIGAAVIDITPDYPVRLTGYGNRSAESEGVASRIHARALVIGGAVSADTTESTSTDCCGSVASPSRGTDVLSKPTTILITVDNCGVPANVTEAVFARVAAKHSITRERFAISSTHTHSGPWLREFAPNIFASIPDEHAARLQKYEVWLIDQLVEVVDEAMSTRRPGHLSLGFGKLGFAINRRSLNNGQWTGFGEVNEGPTDKRFPVLAAQDTKGALIAVLGNYACHATTETGQLNSISGDWPGIAASNIEVLYPGAVALIAIGCGADANPSPRGTHDLAKQHAETVTKEVRRLLSGLKPDNAAPNADKRETNSSSDMNRIDPNIICDIERIDLPLGPVPTRDELQALTGDSGVIGSRARYFLKLLDGGKQVPTTVPDYPVQTWCFGKDLAMVFLGGEVVVDYSIRMHEMFDGDRLWINAYSNDVPCYIASKRILREGGYEADSSMRYYRQPTRLAPETEDIICDTVQKLLPHHFYSKDLQADFPAPKSPEESLATITIRPGLKAELVAAEPLIADPVAFDWDINGRLWVVEMGGYPAGKPRRAGAENDEPLHGTSKTPSATDSKVGIGRVRVLEDIDGDGRYDTAVTFLDGLSFPTGLHPWRDGWLITCAPDIIYAEDTNGDFIADKQTVLYTGFTEGNQQHQVNGLRWGLDGWLYLANGDSGGEVRAVGSVLNETSEISGKPINTRGRDIRIHPDTGAIETLSGQTQSGRNRDDFGNWFGNNNSNPIWHYVLEDRYLKRNPFATGLTTKAEVAAIPGAAPVYPTSKTQARFNDFHAANRFTSACSTAIYRDNLLAEEFYGNAFTCEPVHNLVSRLVLERNGATFKGRRAADEQTSEFFASSDNWTRPVMVRTGPDGALYIADMYRQVIEHPQWIPAEYQRKMDLYAGNTLGRIYRVVPDAAATSNTDESDETREWLKASDSKITIDELLERLASPNGWWRDTAQRILAHQDSNLPQDKIATLIGHQSAAVRVQAIAALAQASTTPQQMQQLSATLAQHLGDSDPEVRRQILRLEALHAGEEMALARVVRDLATSASEIDLQQLALLMGSPRVNVDASAFTLMELLRNHGNDAYIRDAAYSSINARNTDTLLQSLSQSPEKVPGRVFGDVLRMAAAFEKGPAVIDAFESLLTTLVDDEKNRSPDAWESAVGVADQIRRSPKLMELVLQHGTAEATWNTACEAASDLSAETDESLPARLAALRFIEVSGHQTENSRRKLLNLFSPESPPQIQQGAISALARENSEQLYSQIYKRWKGLTPSVRATALDAILARPQRAIDLLTAIEEETLTVSDVDATYRERLLNHHESTVREAAQRILGVTTPSARTTLVQNLQSAIADLKPNRSAGKAVFEKRCASCHKIGDVGQQIGADLAALKNRSTDALLTAILDPNRAVEAKFLSYTATTSNGRTFSGMLLNETGNSLTLRGTDGKEQVIARTDLEELACSSRSLMPEGLEKDLSPQDLADVISYVQSSETEWKRFDGNQPRVITANDDGILTLPASAAKIHGPNLVFEGKFQNLGWWSSTSDYAVWTIDVPKSGHWTVEFNYACDDSTAGNAIKLSTGTRLLTARVPGTGNWDTYRTWSVGQIDLGKGRRELTVTAPERPTTALIDLKSIKLIPPE